MNDYKINKEGLELIKRFEGFRGQKYKRLEGGGYAIGYGHNILPDENIPDSITMEMGEELLKKDIEWAENLVKKCITVPLTENQFSALVSLAYNLRNFCNCSLVKKINSGKEVDIVDFTQYTKAYNPTTKRKEFLKGLLVRRIDEYKLFKKE